MLSFIIPAYNEELELPATLAAVKHAAECTRQAHEVIVVDDASTDRTARIAESAGARVVAIRRRQIAAARNAGARLARGDVLFFVDADTRISPLHISGALEALRAGFAAGSAKLQPDGVLPIWARMALPVFCWFYFAARLGVGAFLFARRDIFDAVGGFDEQYFAGEEVYFSIAVKQLGRFKILSEPIVTSGRKVRMHSAAHVLTRSALIVFGGPRALRRRDKLGLWYDGKRELNRALENAEASLPAAEL